MARGSNLILLWNLTTTGAGLVVGDAKSLRYGNYDTGINRNKYPWALKLNIRLVDSTNGASATIQPQVCDDNSSWASLGSAISLTIATGAKDAKFEPGLIYKVKFRFFRLNVTALSGGSAPALYAYCSHDHLDA